MKITPQTWIILGLLAFIALYIAFDKPPQPDLSPYKIAIAEADIRISQLKTDSAKLASKIHTDSVRQSQEKTTYVRTISEKSREIENMKRNPRVVEVRITEPEVNDLITAMESQDSIKTERIETLEIHLSALRADMNAVKGNFSKLLAEERVKFQSQGEQLTKTMKENRKLRRRVKVAKVLVPVAAGLGLFLGAQF